MISQHCILSLVTLRRSGNSSGGSTIGGNTIFKPLWPMYPLLFVLLSSHGGRSSGKIRCSSSLDWRKSSPSANASGKAQPIEELWKEYFEDPHKKLSSERMEHLAVSGQICEDHNSCVIIAKRPILVLESTIATPDCSLNTRIQHFNSSAIEANWSYLIGGHFGDPHSQETITQRITSFIVKFNEQFERAFNKQFPSRDQVLSLSL